MKLRKTKKEEFKNSKKKEAVSTLRRDILATITENKIRWDDVFRCADSNSQFIILVLLKLISNSRNGRDFKQEYLLFKALLIMHLKSSSFFMKLDKLTLKFLWGNQKTIQYST